MAVVVEPYLNEAFVAVSHCTLVDKLRKYGLRKWAVRWTAKWLKGWAQSLAMSGGTRGRGHKRKHMEFHGQRRPGCFSVRLVQEWKRWWSLHPWRYCKPEWPWSRTTCSSWPCLSGGLKLIPSRGSC